MSGNDQEPAIAAAASTKKFRQKTPFIERIAQLGIWLTKKNTNFIEKKKITKKIDFFFFVKHTYNNCLSNCIPTYIRNIRTYIGLNIAFKFRCNLCLTKIF